MNHMGHVGGALILTAIVVSTLDELAVMWFTGVAVAASLLPDIDLHLPYFLHQGVIHTYPVMALVSVAVGLAAAGVAAATSGRGNSDRGDPLSDPKRAFSLVTGAMILGTFSHVTLDLVTYKETFYSKPVEPLWPFTDWVPRINVFPHNPLARNYAFLAIGVVLWVAVVVTKRRHRT